MMLRMLSTGFLLAGAAPALAQAADTSGSKADPNRIVCERYEETGSRLGSRRVCKTAREWEEQRSGQRADVEKAQRNAGVEQSN